MRILNYIIAVLVLAGCETGHSVETTSSQETYSSANRLATEPQQTPSQLPNLGSGGVWRSTFKGVSFDWDGEELLIERAGRKKQGVFSQIARNDYEAQLNNPGGRDCDYSHYFKLVSVVGSIISFDHETGLICGIASSDRRFRSFDLERSGEFIYPVVGEDVTRNSQKYRQSKFISLSDIFPESEILSGLLKNDRIDKEVSAAIRSGRLLARPATLDEFDDYFTRPDYEKFGGHFYFEADFLYRFAFHHIEGENVAIWVNLSPTSGSKKAVFQEHIEIHLSIPEKYRQSFTMSDSKSEGFMMKDAESVVGIGVAKYEFSKPNPRPVN